MFLLFVILYVITGAIIGYAQPFDVGTNQKESVKIFVMNIFLWPITLVAVIMLGVTKRS